MSLPPKHTATFSILSEEILFLFAACEHNDGQMLLEVQRVVEGRVPVDFLGKIDGTTITPTEILAKIKEVY